MRYPEPDCRPSPGRLVTQLHRKVAFRPRIPLRWPPPVRRSWRSRPGSEHAVWISCHRVRVPVSARWDATGRPLRTVASGRTSGRSERARYPCFGAAIRAGTCFPGVGRDEGSPPGPAYPMSRSPSHAREPTTGRHRTAGSEACFQLRFTRTDGSARADGRLGLQQQWLKSGC